ncbi:MAG TPA: metal-dependent hydrolase [Oligoflexia bacterium]|nr:metal-dependent hydrolase [Oligoflexia bacterium]HMP47883.1 metal-dependent hydrolase [Oligoflexia bacterium]
MNILTFLGHSTVLLQSINKKRILIDPFLDSNPVCPPEFHVNSISPVDHIVLTHGHSDHTAQAMALAKKSGAKVSATYELAMLISKFSNEEVQVIPMNKGGTILLPDTDIRLSLLHAVHSNSFDAPDGTTHYAGEACSVLLQLENGKSLFHAGDTCFFSDMSYIKDKYAPEVACLPIGDCFTMGPREAAIAASVLGVNIAIPVHWGTFPLLTGKPDEFKSECSNLNIESICLEPGSSMEF